MLYLEGVTADETGLHSYTYSLSWLAPQEAIGSVLLAKGLDGDEACALYGIKIEFLNTDGIAVKTEDPCSNGRIIRGSGNQLTTFINHNG